MAGSFNFFRKYQRSMLVAVAVLAMLAFFVLPPFLQMGAGSSSADPVVVEWEGGAVREDQLERAVALRTLVNRFLMQAAATAGRDPSRLPAFPEGEELVVREMLLAKEAEKIGLTVSNTAINEFLAAWTNNMVRQDQFDGIIAGLRYGRAPVLAADLFESLRTALIARNTLLLFQTGFSGDPPAWRWDFYKRLEQSATVEVFPIEVENLATSVELPNESKLKAYFDTYKNDLPSAMSPNPGFKEPHRIQYASLMADQKKFEAAAESTITDKDIEEFYEKNKETRFREAPSAPPVTKEPATNPDDESRKKKPTMESAKEKSPQDVSDAPVNAGQETGENAPKKSKDSKENERKVEGKESAEPSDSDTSFRDRKTPVRTVAFQVEKEGSSQVEKKESSDTESSKNVKQKADEKPTVEIKTAGSGEEKQKSPEKEGEDSADSEESAMTFQPLDKVADQIRQEISRQRATETIDAIFSALAADLNAYAEDRALWIARGKDGDKEPSPPNVEKIAEKQDLVAVESDWTTVAEAAGGGGIGSSFEFVPDPSSRFGIRQQRWLETMFGDGTITLRPVTSRDAEGNRYFSWKQGDKEERVPSFTEARSNVEKAWRIVEARPIALKQATALVDKTGAKSFEESLSKSEFKQVEEVGPFTWLTQGAVGVNGAPVLSSPEGLVMPGNKMMQKIFSVSEGQSIASFNEPQTICYVVRLLEYKPAEEELQNRFEDVLGDQRRLSMVAQTAFAEVFMDWIATLEKDLELTWNRDPRPPR
ncbi:MAG: hypothetical protein HON07_11375 [Planctomycetaceae bacterium]|nr:hypothetical protein [Planctomycetaceae bacterium]